MQKQLSQLCAQDAAFYGSANTLAAFLDGGVGQANNRENRQASTRIEIGLNFDNAAFKADDGLATVDASGRTRVWEEWREWLGRRAGAGKLAPKGWPASKRFRPR